jgi:7-cyano-7-deazaguanine synthase
MKAVVLLSGGMDSCTAMAQAVADGASELVAVSIKYGSMHQQAESVAAINVAGWYGAEFVGIKMPDDIFKDAGSALMGDQAMPHMTYQEIDKSQGPSPTVVPFRNANFLSIATSLAIKYKAQYVYAGMHGEDAHNFAYPDCTPEFLGAMANAIYVGSYHEVRLQFPLIWMSKADVCKRGLQLGAPFHLTWSCYDPRDYGSAMPSTERWLQCGKCPTCVERIEAFRKNGIIDPVPYFGTTVDWTDCIPFMIGGSYVQR